jgi:hypothetical protein
MPFNYLGTMREAQWKCFRNWVLTERQSVASRLKVIDAELKKIGHITVVYREVKEVVQTPTGAVDDIQNVTEERKAFFVATGSTLEKLIQAYIAAGGNPMGISLWLQPDTTQFATNPDEDPNPNEVFTRLGPPSIERTAPYDNVIAPESTDSYGAGGQYPGGLPTFIRSIYRIVGRYFPEVESGAKVAIRMDHARRWVRQEISELCYMENRIMKMMDLREQLSNERDILIQQSVGGSVPDFPLPPDPDRFARNLHLTRIVTEMDRVFYKTTPEGEVDFDELNLREDDGTDPNNVVPTGLSFYDTLTPNPVGTDDFATG